MSESNVNKELLASELISSLTKIQKIIDKDLKEPGEKCAHGDPFLSRNGFFELCNQYWDFMESYRIAIFEMCQKAELCEATAPFMMTEIAANFASYACCLSELVAPGTFDIAFHKINESVKERRKEELESKDSKNKH